MSFKSTHTFIDRFNETTRILEKYPDRIPLICEKAKNASSSCPNIDKNKYLVPNDLTVGHFVYVIRKRLKLSPEKAIFLFINGSIPSGSTLLCHLYDIYKDKDGFLYITYTFENTFGYNLTLI
jgi:GABA(A) receptor-associated protein